MIISVVLYMLSGEIGPSYLVLQNGDLSIRYQSKKMVIASKDKTLNRKVSSPVFFVGSFGQDLYVANTTSLFLIGTSKLNVEEINRADTKGQNELLKFGQIEVNVPAFITHVRSVSPDKRFVVGTAGKLPDTIRTWLISYEDDCSQTPSQMTSILIANNDFLFGCYFLQSDQHTYLCMNDDQLSFFRGYVYRVKSEHENVSVDWVGGAFVLPPTLDSSGVLKGIVEEKPFNP